MVKVKQPNGVTKVVPAPRRPRIVQKAPSGRVVPGTTKVYNSKGRLVPAPRPRTGSFTLPDGQKISMVRTPSGSLAQSTPRPRIVQKTPSGGIVPGTTKVYNSKGQLVPAPRSRIQVNGKDMVRTPSGALAPALPRKRIIVPTPPKGTNAQPPKKEVYNSRGQLVPAPSPKRPVRTIRPTQSVFNEVEAKKKKEAARQAAIAKAKRPPTFRPTKAPVAKIIWQVTPPTVKSTGNAKSKPKPKAASAPSPRAGSGPSVPVSFAATMTMTGVTLAAFTATTAINVQTLQETIADTIASPSIASSNVLNLVASASGSGTVSEPRRLQSANSLSVSFRVSGSAPVSSGATSQTLSAALVTNVNNGQFNTILDSAVYNNGATALANAKCSGITISFVGTAPVPAPKAGRPTRGSVGGQGPPTTDDAYQPTPEPKASALNAGEGQADAQKKNIPFIVGGVVGGLALLALLVGGFWWVNKHKKSKLEEMGRKSATFELRDFGGGQRYSRGSAGFVENLYDGAGRRSGSFVMHNGSRESMSGRASMSGVPRPGGARSSMSASPSGHGGSEFGRPSSSRSPPGPTVGRSRTSIVRGPNL